MPTRIWLRVLWHCPRCLCIDFVWFVIIFSTQSLAQTTRLQWFAVAVVSAGYLLGQLFSAVRGRSLQFVRRESGDMRSVSMGFSDRRVGMLRAYVFLFRSAPFLGSNWSGLAITITNGRRVYAPVPMRYSVQPLPDFARSVSAQGRTTLVRLESLGIAGLEAGSRLGGGGVDAAGRQKKRID